MSSYRSKFEAAVSKTLNNRGVPFKYEDTRIDYTIEGKYLTDFSLSNGIFLEVKGYFPPKDRRKMLAIKKQHPELDVRMVFQRDQKLSKNSKLTYGMWCNKHDILWCVYPNIPHAWLS